MTTLETVTKIVGAGVLFVAALIVVAPLNALAGAIAGWTVELFWGDAILRTLRAVGLPDRVSMWHLGATLGFVGSFLRTRTTVSKA